MHTTVKRLVALGGMMVMLVLVASITVVPAFALSSGIYTAEAHPFYRDPTTGQVDDAGGDANEVLGQSMTESATYNRALVEVDAEGNTFVTIRMRLIDNIENVSFQVDGQDVTADCMQENFEDNTADFRFPVPSEASNIRVSMYVSAMGRDVVYYVNLTDLEYGCEDFITSIDAPMEGTGPIDAATPAPAVTAAPQTAQSAQTEADESAGLQEFDASGNVVGGEEDASQSGSASGSAMPIVLAVIAVAVIGGCIWYFGFFRKKK